MTIYEELIQRVQNGETFYINFEDRTLKVGKDKLVDNGSYDTNRKLFGSTTFTAPEIIMIIDGLYRQYKYSLPSERSDNKRRHYFKALKFEELTDEQLLRAELREVRQAYLEGFILCMVLEGQIKWNELTQGNWFYKSASDDDLVILRSWIEK